MGIAGAVFVMTRPTPAAPRRSSCWTVTWNASSPMATRPFATPGSPLTCRIAIPVCRTSKGCLPPSAARPARLLAKSRGWLEVRPAPPAPLTTQWDLMVRTIPRGRGGHDSCVHDRRAGQPSTLQHCPASSTLGALITPKRSVGSLRTRLMGATGVARRSRDPFPHERKPA